MPMRLPATVNTTPAQPVPPAAELPPPSSPPLSRARARGSVSASLTRPSLRGPSLHGAVNVRNVREGCTPRRIDRRIMTARAPRPHFAEHLRASDRSEDRTDADGPPRIRQKAGCGRWGRRADAVTRRADRPQPGEAGSNPLTILRCPAWDARRGSTRSSSRTASWRPASTVPNWRSPRALPACASVREAGRRPCGTD